MSGKILLTGISGWIAKHTAIELLNSGYEVLGTIRNKNLIDQTKETISKYASIEKLSANLDDCISVKILSLLTILLGKYFTSTP